MIARIAGRAALALLTLLLSTLLLYVAIRSVPGSPWAHDDATPPERIERWMARHHLDRGFAAGYVLWAGQTLRGDLGTSYSVAEGEQVSTLVRNALPVSLTLGVLGFGAAVIFSLFLGILAARRPGGAGDRLASVSLYILNAAPTFWIALLLQDLLAVRLRWLPPLGAGPLQGSPGGIVGGILARIPFWILPPVCLALGSMAFFFRFSRAGLLDAMRSPHVRAARARGLPETLVIGRHAVSATLVHLVTLMGLLAPAVIGGSVIIERVFALPGLGRLFFEAASQRDYPVVMGVGLVMAVVAIAASAAADMITLLAEPRLRTGEARL
ncbi:MAG TPA: ABC transporter permease [Candidatus Saccharimonadales bacterium]|nr:ABC transporter permease [Candidatus Saccharimonadales bacterium]